METAAAAKAAADASEQAATESDAAEAAAGKAVAAAEEAARAAAEAARLAAAVKVAAEAKKVAKDEADKALSDAVMAQRVAAAEAEAAELEAARIEGKSVTVKPCNTAAVAPFGTDVQGAPGVNLKATAAAVAAHAAGSTIPDKSKHSGMQGKTCGTRECSACLGRHRSHTCGKAAGMRKSDLTGAQAAAVPPVLCPCTAITIAAATAAATATSAGPFFGAASSPGNSIGAATERSVK
eukprot:2079960-Prymnesium_polylepis.1